MPRLNPLAFRSHEPATLPTTPDERALAKSLKEMVECYGEMDDIGTPIGIITRAVRAIRRVSPKYKFEDY